MKDFFKGLAVITASLILFPAVPFVVGALNPPEEPVAAVSPTPPADPVLLDAVTEVNVYDSVNDRIMTMTTGEYITATIAAQLSPDAEPELLKAQAVLMYTYVLRRRMEEVQNPTPELFGCDVGTDTSKYPALLLQNDIKFDLEPFRAAAAAVEGMYCSYNGEPITVAYCYSAGTRTESAETVLGFDIPYLQSTPSGEPDAYITTVSYTSDEVFARLTTSDKGYVLLGDADGWIKEKETTENGYVKWVYLDSRFIVSGNEIATLLNLPSARFAFRYSPATDRFTFTVSGSGSLVGLSQLGGNALAKEGYNFREILYRYFKDIDILQTKDPSI